MKEYHATLADITEDDVKKEIEKGTDRRSVQLVNAGIPIRDVAQDLAYDHLRMSINTYGAKEISEKWNVALPELNAGSGFRWLGSTLSSKYMLTN